MREVFPLCLFQLVSHTVSFLFVHTPMFGTLSLFCTFVGKISGSHGFCKFFVQPG